MTSENRTEATRRRLPRFKLGTILVLVAICALIMSIAPWRNFYLSVFCGFFGAVFILSSAMTWLVMWTSRRG